MVFAINRRLVGILFFNTIINYCKWTVAWFVWLKDNFEPQFMYVRVQMKPFLTYVRSSERSIVIECIVYGNG